MTSPPRPMARFQKIHRNVPPCPFTKIAKMVLLLKTKWPPELKIEKPFQKRHLQGPGPNFKISSLKCFSNAPVPKLLNGLAPLNFLVFRRTGFNLLIFFSFYMSRVATSLFHSSDVWHSECRHPYPLLITDYSCIPLESGVRQFQRYRYS